MSRRGDVLGAGEVGNQAPNWGQEQGVELRD